MTFPKGNGQDCPRAWELMPWVLQNTAPQEQNEWLSHHVAHCESCRQEYAQQARLQRALSLPSDIPMDVNAGLGRLMDRLDAPVVEETSYRPRYGNWFSRALVAIVLIQALGIGALSLKSWSTTETAPYRTLSQTAAPVPADAIRVVPDATMTLSDWDALLRGLRLQIVGGPNDVGAYTVMPTHSSSTAQSMLQQLRATPGIRLAEPVAATP